MGDELLLQNGDGFFLGGMLAFAAMQVSYMLAFLDAGASWNPKTRVATGASMGYGIAYVLLLARLLPSAGTFAIPIGVYGFLLTLMASFAAQMNRLTALGGLCFVASDMTLAVTKFQAAPFGASTHAIVMATYFAAQLLITYGMMMTRCHPERSAEGA